MTITGTITDRLNRLADLQARKDVLALEKQALVDAAIPAPVRQQLREIEAEYAEKFQRLENIISTLENDIGCKGHSKTDVLANGANVKGQYLQAVWNRGRVSWDTKGLDGYAVVHPEINVFRSQGDPSLCSLQPVSMRKI